MQEPDDRSLSVRASQERETRRSEVVFINETNPLQPYTRNGELQRFVDFSGNNEISLSPVSDEGFHHNEARQCAVGESFSQIFSLGSRGGVLEVGPGSNTFVAEGVLSDAHVPISLVDSNGGSPGTIKEGPSVKGMRTYHGSVGHISAPSSALRKDRFGTIMFNGSWVAGGYNFTVKDNLSIEYQDLHPVPFLDTSSPEYQRFQDDQIDMLLRSARDHLTENGVILISSARFAFHGAGYSFSQLPVEKLEFLDLIARAQRLGAKKITVIGVSSEGMETMLQTNVMESDNKAAREAQVFREFFIGRSITRGPEYTLTNDDAAELPFEELQEFCKNPVHRAAFLEKFPDVADRIRKRLEEYEQSGKEIVRQLTGGVDALPDTAPYSTFTPDVIRVIKNQTKRVVSSDIARIDAIGIEF